MDSFLDEAASDSLERSLMSIDEKRQLVYKLSKDSNKAFIVLHKWKKEEIREILCAESGDERKLTSFNKAKIINKLLKIVSEKHNSDHQVDEKRDSSPNIEKSKTEMKIESDENSEEEEQEEKRDLLPNTKNLKKKRKRNTYPSCYVTTNFVQTSDKKKIIYCENMACQDIMRDGNTFCKRCSCFICHKFDENKDPSLWLTCISNSPFTGESCGFSFHLECIFKTEKSGMTEENPSNHVDACYYCVSCGKTNTLLECLKKQLMIAKETSRVDILCFRLLLSQNILKGTEKHTKLAEFVEKAVNSLETEFGSRLTGFPSKMSRGIVNRLNSAQEVKKLFCYALEVLDDILLSSTKQRSMKITFEDVHETSLTLILGFEESCSSGNIIHYGIWHRKVSEKDYPKDSTCELFTPNSRFVVSELSSGTEYYFKVVTFNGAEELSVYECKVSTQSPQKEDEIIAASCLISLKEIKPLEIESNIGDKKVSLITSLKSDYCEDRPENAINGENLESCGCGWEHCMKIIRELERLGYIEKNFRQKFMTWFNCRATIQEINVVETIVDAFKDDPKAMADQIVDTLSDCVSRN